MDNIVSDNGFVIGSIKHLNMLIHLAERRTESLGIPFKKEDFKWVLGAEILYGIQTSEGYLSASSVAPYTLFGVDVVEDYVNPKNIQLYENITNKL